MEVETRRQLARLGTLLLDAIGELEELNDVLEVALGVEPVEPRQERPFQGLRTLVGFRPAQLARAERLLSATTAALDALPAEVDLPAVGRVQVTSAQTVAVAPTWADRLTPTPNRRTMVAKVREVRSEITAALGDLERARTHARLCAMRIDDG